MHIISVLVRYINYHGFKIDFSALTFRLLVDFKQTTHHYFMSCCYAKTLKALKETPKALMGCVFVVWEFLVRISEGSEGWLLAGSMVGRTQQWTARCE